MEVRENAENKELALCRYSKGRDQKTRLLNHFPAHLKETSYRRKFGTVYFTLVGHK